VLDVGVVAGGTRVALTWTGNAKDGSGSPHACSFWCVMQLL